MILLILWTIQTELAYQKLINNGILRNDGRRINKLYRKDYLWMIEQMKKRIPQKPPVKYPLWAWHQYDGIAKPKPDLRKTGHLRRGEFGYRIEFEIADELVLLSDFDNWHWVLNSWYLSPNKKEWEKFHREFKKIRSSPSQIPYETEPFRSRIIDSWENIFDLEFGDPKWHGPVKDRQVQATFWELKKERVREITRFKAR